MWLESNIGRDVILVNLRANFNFNKSENLSIGFEKQNIIRIPVLFNGIE